MAVLLPKELLQIKIWVVIWEIFMQTNVLP